MSPFALVKYFGWDWRSGDLLFGLSLLLAVAVVTAVGIFTQRVELALTSQGGELLAADLVVRSTEPLPQRLTDQATAAGLMTATTLSFPSVLTADGRPQLVEIKAVGANYPLRGSLRIRQAPDDPEQTVHHGPGKGGLWVEPQLLPLLDKQLGEIVKLGDLDLQLERRLTHEPDRGGNLLQLAPRVLMSLEDIPATGLVTPASRVSHGLLVAGPAAELGRYRNWLSENLPRDARIIDLDQARPELRAALDRGGRFLALAALTTVLLAGAAIALSMRRLVSQLSTTVAVLRCLGASRRLILFGFLLRQALIGLLASALGCLLGLAAQLVLGELLGAWFGSSLPPPGPTPLLQGLVTGIILLLGFSLPPLVRLQRVPPVRVLRRDLGELPPAFWLTLAMAVLAMILLIFWQADDFELALRVLLGVALGLGVFLAGSLLLLLGLTPLQGRLHGIWRHACTSLTRHRGFTALQLTGFATGIMALLLLTLVRIDLLELWQQSLPEETPNRFLINIQPDQTTAMAEFLAQSSVGQTPLFPMIRGRLVRINDRSVAPADYPDDRAQRLLAREFNLSWSNQLQPDNRILSGTWWGESANPLPQFSVEHGLANTLRIQRGDRITFLVAGQEVEARVSNLRTVQWDSFQVNFFVIGTPDLLQNLPSTFITSFRLPSNQEALMRELVRRFPNVTLLDISAILQHVRAIIERGVLAVEYVFAFTLIAGILVLHAGIQNQTDARTREAAILRTLGARRRQLLLAAAAEFSLLGLLAGLLAAACATATAYLISDQLLGLTFRFNPMIWLVGTLGGAVGVGLAGVIASLPLLRRPPKLLLRHG